MIRTRQPQGAVRVNWGSSLSRALAFCAPLNPGGGFQDIAGNQLGVRTGLGSQTVAPNGSYPLFGTGSYLDFSNNIAGVTGATPVTIAWTQTVRTPLSYSALLNWKPPGAANTFLIYQSASDSMYYFVAGLRGGTPVSFSAVVGTQVDGRTDRYALVMSSGVAGAAASFALFANGSKLTTAATQGFGANTDAAFRIGARDAGSDPFEGGVGNFHIWTRALSDAEGAIWSTPGGEFSCYAPSRRVWVQLAANEATTDTADGATVTATASAIAGSATGNSAVDAAADGASVGATASAIAGSATAASATTAAMVAATASVVAGSATAASATTAATVAATASTIAGSATAASAASSATVTATASAQPGTASGTASGTATGATQIATASPQPGSATAASAATGSTVTATASALPGTATGASASTATGATVIAAAEIVVGAATASSAAASALAIATASAIAGTASSATPQKVQPASDISTGGWTSSLGGALYDALNETTQDDGDYVYSPNNPTTETFEVKLAAMSDPLSSAGHILRIGLAALNLDTTFDLKLVQGTTVLDSWSETVTAGTTATRSRTFDASVANAISDYTDVRIRVTAHG
jgi:hypothetical protein